MNGILSIGGRLGAIASNEAFDSPASLKTLPYVYSLYGEPAIRDLFCNNPSRLRQNCGFSVKLSQVSFAGICLCILCDTTAGALNRDRNAKWADDVMLQNAA